jgi:nucleoside-diphosphate-sugar epimerase
VRALVTGSAGFVGRHMVRELIARGFQTVGCDLARCPEYYASTDDARWHFRTGGGGEVYDLVVHCAYHVGGRAAIDGEPRLLARNLELDAAMFDWAVRTGQRRVLYFSSSAAYPVMHQNLTVRARLYEEHIDLDDVKQPDARYGWAKLTGEQLARAATESGLVVHVVRPFSGYGEDQSLDYPFPSIVARARKGDLTVWGPPGQTRDWIHVSDVVSGALAVVDADIREPVNLCTGIGTEMGDLALMVARQAGAVWVAGAEGSAGRNVEYQPDRPTGVMYRVGDPARMQEIYQPKISIEEGVRRALAS